MKQYPDPTRRRGRPLRNPSHDARTPEEIAWWNKNVSDPTRANAKPLPLLRFRTNFPTRGFSIVNYFY